MNQTAQSDLILPEWQRRLINEKIQLDEKIEKLTHFIETGTVDSDLQYKDLDLLEVQLAAMSTYSRILAARLNRL